MPLDPVALTSPGTPEHWMAYLATRLIDRNRAVRFGRLQAYLDGTPPLPMVAASDRRGWYQFHQLGRVNMAQKVVRAKRDRMKIRAIRTAATTDDRGDMVAWRYWTRSNLPAVHKDVHDDMLGLSEAYVRVSLATDGTPVALRRDPRTCIAIEDPLDPLKTLAGFELLYDEITGTTYAYLWIRGSDAAGQPVGQQWVAVAKNLPRPASVRITGLTADDARRFGWWWPQLTFDATQFDMRPQYTDVLEGERDGGPYCQTFPADVVPLFRFPNRNGVGEFEKSLSTLDRINRTVMDRVVLQALQAYKQRVLEQDLPANPAGKVTDRMPSTDPKTNEPINWAELLQPGPDALMKLPPGVKLRELAAADIGPLINAAKDDMVTLGVETDTPLPAIKDDVNESADGAQYKREPALFAVEDIRDIAGGKWAQVIACLFLFADDSERYAPGGRGKPKIDRADAGQIVIDWAPAERHSLSERADADSKNKTLSVDDSARIIWGLSPDEVALNRERRKADIAELPIEYRASELPQGIAANEVEPADPSAPAA